MKANTFFQNRFGLFGLFGLFRISCFYLALWRVCALVGEPEKSKKSKACFQKKPNKHWENQKQSKKSKEMYRSFARWKVCALMGEPVKSKKSKKSKAILKKRVCLHFLNLYISLDFLDFSGCPIVFLFFFWKDALDFLDFSGLACVAPLGCLSEWDALEGAQERPQEEPRTGPKTRPKSDPSEAPAEG